MNMQVILLKQVEKLGQPGDIKDVSAGYFRNFLFPRGFAELKTTGSLEKAERMRARILQRDAKERQAFVALLDALREQHIVILRKATDEGHLFGSVTEDDIASALAKKGYNLNEKYIHIETHIKELGTYPISLKFDEAVMGSISITVEREA